LRDSWWGERIEAVVTLDSWEMGMRRRRSRLVRIAVVWTLFMLGVAIVLAAGALLRLNNAEQACFVNYPATPCPTGDDPAVAQLTVAFFMVPLGWLIGLGIVALIWSLTRREQSRDRGVGG
jgi:hypothetical protein